MGALTRFQACFLLPPALVCAVLLFIGGPGPDSLRSVRYFWVVGHLFCFGLWSYLYLALRDRLSFWRQFVEITLFCFLVGGSIELLQGQIGREPSWQDVYNDVLGGWLAVMFFSQGKASLPRLWLHLVQFPVVVLVAFALLPLSKAVVDDLIAWHQFPLLSGFETPFEETRWIGKSRRQTTSDVAYTGSKALRVELMTGRYPGVFLQHFPSDWHQYQMLSMQVYNPNSAPLELHFRIHDQLHRTFDNLHRDRYNSRVELQPGWNEIIAPLSDVAGAPRDRILDLKRVAGIGLFAVSLEQPQIIYVDDVRLLPMNGTLTDDRIRD